LASEAHTHTQTKFATHGSLSQTESSKLSYFNVLLVQLHW